MTLVVDVRGLSTRYGSVPVLRGVDFGLARAEVVGLIGRNGSGKTTFLRTLLGLARFEAGRIEWTGTGTAVPPDAVDHFGGAHTLPPHVQANIWVRLVSRGDAVCDDRRPLRALSRGSRQLLGLRAVLARTPLAAVLLDEPWEGLDPDGARWLTETLRRRRKEGCAFLVSSHRLHDLAALCDRYAFLRDGRLEVRSAGDFAGRTVEGADLLRTFDRIDS
ncbi:MAG TPA: ATP-binding cassette domain-containing protein [Thermoanaerobaculia bacterium]|nr:ATP-binding cassette domain-containing protein [Thermoanaerobaculia bacterium]